MTTTDANVHNTKTLEHKKNCNNQIIRDVDELTSMCITKRTVSKNTITGWKVV